MREARLSIRLGVIIPAIDIMEDAQTLGIISIHFIKMAALSS